MLRSLTASLLAAPSTFIFKDVATAWYVFLRHNTLRGALQAPFVDPYRVLHRSNKTCTIEVRGAAKAVSIDRLKPGYVLHVNTEPASPPAIPSSITTRPGRRVRFPDYLVVQGSRRGRVVDVTGYPTHPARIFCRPYTAIL